MTTTKIASARSKAVAPPFRRHLNKIRWISLSLVFLLLILLPLISVYQNYIGAHAYDLLLPQEQRFYDVMEALTFFSDDPAEDLDAIKGTTWSGNLFGLKLSDPLAVVGQFFAGLSVAGLNIYWPFVLTALIPLGFTLLFGRFFCGWICPATLLYELNTNLGIWLQKQDLYRGTGNRRFDRRLKYGVLIAGLLLSALTGSVLVAAIYPPAIIGRELYYALALAGFGSGTVFFIATLLFDLLVSRRGFCRYLCPGGALYALLGRYRLVRIQRKVKHCNDCAKCNAVCEFGLNPMHDDFGQECNNCTACIAVCPTDALIFAVQTQDSSAQGAGHLGQQYRHQQKSAQQGNDA
ncbi:MAG: 4Fe-4S binding protein [Motiliproteus sp.]